jgi:hypothetical protein
MTKRRVPAVFRAVVPAAFILAVAVSTGPATAQSVQGVVAPVTVPSTTGATTDAISNNATRALEAYVDILIDVDRVVRQWQSHVDQVAGTQQESVIRAQADAAIVDTIQRDGRMTVTDYQRIGAAAVRDPALMAQIQQMYRQRAGN